MRTAAFFRASEEEVESEVCSTCIFITDESTKGQQYLSFNTDTVYRSAKILFSWAIRTSPSSFSNMAEIQVCIVAVFWSGNTSDCRSAIHITLDHGVSKKEPIIPLWSRIYRFF